MPQNTLLILTGPSCAGKSPLVQALKRLHYKWATALQPLVLYNSRTPRPGERDGSDYHFRQRDELEARLADPNCVCMDVRGDYQVLEVSKLKKQLSNGAVLFEGNPFIARVLQTDPRLHLTPRRSVFLSPLSREEIGEMQAMQDAPPVEDAVAEIMRRKLIRRTENQKGQLQPEDLETIYQRSKSAWKEICMAPLFDKVVVNHDGEDSDNWTCAPVLLGEARRATQAVFDGLTGIENSSLEEWDELLP